MYFFTQRYIYFFHVPLKGLLDGTAFRFAYKQGIGLLKNHHGISEHSVFIRLLSKFSIGSVKAKIAGELKDRKDSGQFICFFEYLGELRMWSYDELRSMISRK